VALGRSGGLLPATTLLIHICYSCSNCYPVCCLSNPQPRFDYSPHASSVSSYAFVNVTNRQLIVDLSAFRGGVKNSDPSHRPKARVNSLTYSLTQASSQPTDRMPAHVCDSRCWWPRTWRHGGWICAAFRTLSTMTCRPLSQPTSTASAAQAAWPRTAMRSASSLATWCEGGRAARQ
jgi:hypothetical protein